MRVALLKEGTQFVCVGVDCYLAAQGPTEEAAKESFDLVLMAYLEQGKSIEELVPTPPDVEERAIKIFEVNIAEALVEEDGD